MLYQPKSLGGLLDMSFYTHVLLFFFKLILMSVAQTTIKSLEINAYLTIVWTTIGFVEKCYTVVRELNCCSDNCQKLYSFIVDEIAVWATFELSNVELFLEVLDAKFF